MRSLSIPALALTALGLAAPPQLLAQEGPGSYSGVRAINLARNTAIQRRRSCTILRSGDQISFMAALA